MAYARMHAIISAMYFADRICPDGCLATGHGYYGKHFRKKTDNGVKVEAGVALADMGSTMTGRFVEHEDDCAHFVSCCVGAIRSEVSVGGSKITLHGGGLNLGKPFYPVYGQTYVAKLAQDLISNGAKIVGKQFRITSYKDTRKDIMEKLHAGDVLLYATKDNHDSYEHSAILVGPGVICCHTSSRRALDYETVYHPWVTLLRLP
jgi:hypothetical protein